MALAKERNPNDHSSNMSGLIHNQSYKLYGAPEESGSPEKKRNFAGSSSNSSSLSSPGSANTNSGGFLYHRNSNNDQLQQEEEGRSVISFKPSGHYEDHGFMQGGRSSGSCCFLNFEDIHDDEQPYSSSNLSPTDHHQLIGSGSFDSMRLLENMTTSFQSGYSIKENHHHHDHDQLLESFAWLNSSSSAAAAAADHNYLATQESSFHKRAHSGESDQQAFKKQCTTNGTSKKSKQKSVQPKDPQSIAAKNRRERISERLKVLQDLVPNGSKVDLVTMLEKAISYVKFLQLQVKVLATDEFWPVQGGKPPELSQVKDAIDAILSSSQRDRRSSSSK
ncbi:hypothetical protein SSX86_003023 [Deinandra increscens subsp. villosa]|uniref:BHLH domain-containing protein n=1 Tax=Deinandra increscens subsp. villosa TaxID=3103831 RepID=A0AAP0DKC4_9ASTR